MSQKAEGAYRTIGELSDDLGVAQHVLRYWETRFPHLKPMQRGGGRRYYGPDDVAVARRIAALLADGSYTVQGVQRLLAGGAPVEAIAPPPTAVARPAVPHADDLWHSLRRIRDDLAEAL